MIILLVATVLIAAAASPPVRLIVDTDAGFDVDDVGALGVGACGQWAAERSRQRRPGRELDLRSGTATARCPGKG